MMILVGDGLGVSMLGVLLSRGFMDERKSRVISVE